MPYVNNKVPCICAVLRRLLIHTLYASASAGTLNVYALYEGDDDLGEEGDGGEVDDADLEDDWGLDTE